MSNVIPIIMEKEEIDRVKHISTFTTKTTVGARGIIVPVDENEDKVILNPYHEGSEEEVVVKMKIVSAPAKRFKEGDHIANLVLL